MTNWTPAAPPPPPAPPTQADCTLCGTPRQVDERCAVCGLHPGLGPTEPDPFDRRAISLIVAVFVAIYAVVFAITAAVN